MNTLILRAQLWELWRLTRSEYPFRILGTLLFLWLFTWMPDGVTDFVQGIVLVFVVLASTLSNLVLSTYDKNSVDSFPFVLGFARPIPVGWLVGVPLAWLLVSNVLVFLFLTSVAQNMFSWEIPQLGLLPVLLLGTTLLATLSWCATGHTERLAVFAIFCGGVLWLVTRGVELLDPRYAEVALENVVLAPGPGGVVAMLAWTVITFRLCVRTIERLRSGESNTLFRFRTFAAKSPMGNLDQENRFRSARHAQWWFDFRRVGNRAMATVGTGLAAMLVFLWGAAEFGGDSVMAILWATSLMITPLAILGGTVEGVLGLTYRGNDGRLSNYEAIRPVTVRQSIMQKLATILGVSLTGWAAFALGALFIAAAFDAGFLLDWSAMLSQVGAAQIAGLIVVGCGLTVATCVSFALLLMSAAYLSPRLKEHPVACWTFATTLTITLAIPAVQGLSGLELVGMFHMCQVLWGVFSSALLSGAFCARRARDSSALSPCVSRPSVGRYSSPRC